MPATMDQLLQRFQALPEVQRQALLRQHVDLVAECSWEAGQALQLELKERRQRAADCARRRNCFRRLRRAEAEAKKELKRAEVEVRKAVKARRALLSQLKRDLKAEGTDRLRALRRQASAVKRLQRIKNAPPPSPPPKPPTLAQRMAAAWEKNRREILAA